MTNLYILFILLFILLLVIVFLPINIKENKKVKLVIKKNNKTPKAITFLKIEKVLRVNVSVITSLNKIYNPIRIIGLYSSFFNKKKFGAGVQFKKSNGSYIDIYPYALVNGTKIVGKKLSSLRIGKPFTIEIWEEPMGWIFYIGHDNGDGIGFEKIMKKRSGFPWSKNIILPKATKKVNDEVKFYLEINND